MKKILVLLIPVLALVGGVAAGEMLRPGAPATDQAEAPADNADQIAPSSPEAEKEDYESEKPADDYAATTDEKGGATAAAGWFTFPTQFFVPLMRNGDMGAVMILTLSIETSESDLAAMEQQEHRLRDALLRELLIHANTGGFDGNFTAEARLAPLRERLHKAAQAGTDLPVKAILIEDIARQAG